MSSKDTDDGDGDGQQMHPLARLHHESTAGGRWWVRFGAEKPEYDHHTVDDTAPQRCETVWTPPVPDEIEWTEYERYTCESCQWTCINRRDSAACEESLCWYCLQDGDLPNTAKIVKEREW